MQGQSLVSRLKIGETKENITLDDIVVSPYQVVVHTTRPGKQGERTEDRRQELLSANPDMTDAELFEILGWSYGFYDTIVFNQDGEILHPDMNREITGSAGFAVQGKEIKTLYIFIFENFDDWIQMKNEGINSNAPDRAVIAAEEHVK